MTLFWIIQALKIAGLLYLSVLAFLNRSKSKKLLNEAVASGGVNALLSLPISFSVFVIVAIPSILLPFLLMPLEDSGAGSLDTALIFVPFYLVFGLISLINLLKTQKVWVFYPDDFIRLDQPERYYHYSDVQYAEFPSFFLKPMSMLHFAVGGKINTVLFDDVQYKAVKEIFQEQTLGVSARNTQRGTLAKALKYGSLVLGLAMLFVFVLSVASMFVQSGQSETPDFTKKSLNYTPMGANVSLGYARGTLFAFDETQGVANAFDLDGNYQYTLNLPAAVDILGGMYFIEDLLVLQDENYVTYAYLDGVFMGYYLTGEDTDDGFSVMFYNNKKDLIQSVPFKFAEDFDFGILIDVDQYCFYSTKGPDLLLYPLNGSAEIIVEPAEDFVSNTITYANDTITVDGVKYYQAWGAIHKVSNNGDQIIVQTDLLTWYFYTPNTILIPFLLAIFFLFILPLIMNVHRRQSILSRLALS